MASAPWTSLPASRSFDAFARDLLASCYVSDPWAYSRRRFDERPLVLDEAFYRRVVTLGDDIGALYNELAQVVWDDPSLLDDFYGMTPYQKAMWLASGGQWHGFARMDAFWCEGDRLLVCELNADTPSGQSDIVAASMALAPHHPELHDVNAAYMPRLVEMTQAWWAARCPDAGPPRTVGIIYPTDLPEDVALVRLYERTFEAMGCRVVLGSPYNLQKRSDGGVAMFDVPIDIVWRHYKTDWWGERLSVHADAPVIPDTEPLEQTLWLLEAEQAGKLLIINPFGALVAQDKRSLALMWEHRDRFSAAAQRTIEAHIPPTYRLETVGLDRLKAERERWVLKSDFGCETDEVTLGRLALDAWWHEELDGCTPGRWVVQEAFDVAADDEGREANIGVYLIGGTTSGLYIRFAGRGEPTTHGATVATPFLNRRPDGRTLGEPG